MAGTTVQIPPNWERYMYNDAFIAYPTPQVGAELCTRFMNSLGLHVGRGTAAGGGGTTTALKKPAAKRTISEAGREKISQAAKKRWKNAKAAGKSGL
jgi:hypothetical protein